MWHNSVIRRKKENPVEAAAKRNIYGDDSLRASRNKSVEKEVVRILKLRMKTADKKIQCLEKEWRTINAVRNAIFEEESFRWCDRGMESPSPWMEREYRQTENDEMREQWENGKTWTVRRADWVASNYGLKTKLDKALKDAGVRYTNDELDRFDDVENVTSESGFVVYGDVYISDVEKEYLDLGPEFREYGNLQKMKWNTEVEVNAIKTRWELMGKEKELKDSMRKTAAEIESEKKEFWKSK